MATWLTPFLFGLLVTTGLDSIVPSEMPRPRRLPRADLTVPAPLQPDH